VQVTKFLFQIWTTHQASDKTAMYVAFFKEVVCRTASLVAQWQCVGFCHGSVWQLNVLIKKWTRCYLYSFQFPLEFLSILFNWLLYVSCLAWSELKCVIKLAFLLHNMCYNHPVIDPISVYHYSWNFAHSAFVIQWKDAVVVLNLFSGFFEGFLVSKQDLIVTKRLWLLSAVNEFSPNFYLYITKQCNKNHIYALQVQLCLSSYWTDLCK